MQVNVLGRSIFLPRVKGKLPRPKPREFEDAYFFFLPFLVNFFRTCLATFLATFSATFLATLAGVAGLAAARDAVVRAGVARGARTAGLAAAGVFGVAGCAAKDSLVMV